MSVFQKALDFTLKWEGGLSSNPHDSGGPTNQGITQETYNRYRKSKGSKERFIGDLEDRERDDIYYSFYWIPIEGDNKPPKLAIACFDWAVNSGPQKALTKYTTDLDEYLDRRRQFYYHIAQGEKAVFLHGWLNRLDDLKKYLDEVNI